MNPDSTAAPKKNRYAWVIFGVCFLMIFIALGYGSSTKGTFLTAVTNSLGLERSLFTIADSIRFITTAILSVFLGRTVERLGLRRMAGLGFTMLVLSFAVNSLATTYWHFYVGGALLGAGLCWTTTSMVGYLVENWFTNGKGTIMGFLLAANGLGGFTSEFVITRVIYGRDGALSYAESRWRLAYAVIAGLFLLTGILAVTLIRDKPSELGLEPLGTDRAKKKKRGADWIGTEPKALFHQPFFYLSAVCVYMTGFVLQSMTNVSKPYMYDLGFDKNYVMLVFASHSLLLMAAKMLTGIGYDTIGLRKTFACCTVCALAALTSLYLLTPEHPAFAWIFSVIGSFGMPLETVMIPLLVSYMFGKKSYKKVLGYFLALNSLGYATGVPLANLAYDLQGTYRNMILVLAVMIALVAVGQQVALSLSDRNKRKILGE